MQNDTTENSPAYGTSALTAMLGKEIEMADAGKCDQEVFDNGEFVGVVVGGNAHVIEAFVKCVAENTGVRMDWHYVGGRARVLAIGDVEKARRGLRDYALQVDA